jgi:Ca2+-binding EF-hand superfamily protein
MGAAVGVESAGAPEDVLQLFKDCGTLQRSIAEADLKFLQSQGRQMWKNHKKIIATVCTKTKSQLSRMAALSDSKVHLSTQLQDMLGGAYGDFVRNLVLRRAEIGMEALRGALDCIGCDEDALVSFLCVCSPEETADLIESYNAAAAVDLAAKINGKIEKNTPLSKFFKILLGSKRDGDLIVDEESASRQMEDIREMCGNTAQEREVELFELLCCLSRTQLAHINTQLVQTHSVTLDALFKKRFTGGCICRALALWTSSRDDAICQSVHAILHDPREEYDRLSSVVSKYGKLQLGRLCEQYEALFKESLISRIEEATIGNQKLALVAWISSAAFDGNQEELIEGIVVSHGSLSGAMAADEPQQLIRAALEKEKAFLEAYSGHQGEAGNVGAIPEPVHMTLPPIASVKASSHDTAAAASSMSAKIVDTLEEKPAAESTEAAPEAKEDVAAPPAETLEEKKEDPASAPALAAIRTDEPESPTKVAPLSAISKRAASIRNLAVDFDAKYKAVSSFLKDEFAMFDTDKSGFLETAEFWNAVRALRLGYTDEEIGGMAEWTDWDCDGRISLSEVINELAESVILMIEGRGEELLSGLAIIKSRLKSETDELKRMESDGGLSVDLVGYLKDSFEAYDTDENGSLGIAEFWKVIQVVLCETVNGFKDIEIEEMRVWHSILYCTLITSLSYIIVLALYCILYYVIIILYS